MALTDCPPATTLAFVTSRVARRGRRRERARRLNAASLALAAATARDVGNLCSNVAPFAPPAVDTSTLNSNLGGGGGDGASGHSTTDATTRHRGTFPRRPTKQSSRERSTLTTHVANECPAPRPAPCAASSTCTS